MLLRDYPTEGITDLHTTSGFYMAKSSHRFVRTETKDISRGGRLYFSRYPEVIQLKCTTSLAVIKIHKGIFSRHGVPEMLVSNNGPEYSSREFIEFVRTYRFSHITSNPHSPKQWLGREDSEDNQKCLQAVS